MMLRRFNIGIIGYGNLMKAYDPGEKVVVMTTQVAYDLIQITNPFS